MTIGVIGVGQLASALVEGWARAGWAGDILLSPRNAAITRDLARRFGCRVAADNQAVADGCETVVLALPPTVTVTVAGAVRWRRGRIAVSVAAGVPLAALEEAVAPATAVRAMPITAAALGESPTPLVPDNATARRVFAALGPVHGFDDEATFEAASVIATFYAWVFALIEATAGWAAAAGVPPASAHDLVAQTLRGAAVVALAEGDAGAIAAEIARPGTYSRLGLDVLRERGALDAFAAACATVHDRLQPAPER